MVWKSKPVPARCRANRAFLAGDALHQPPKTNTSFRSSRSRCVTLLSCCCCRRAGARLVLVEDRLVSGPRSRPNSTSWFCCCARRSASRLFELFGRVSRSSRLLWPDDDDHWRRGGHGSASAGSWHCRRYRRGRAALRHAIGRRPGHGVARGADAGDAHQQQRDLGGTLHRGLTTSSRPRSEGPRSPRPAPARSRAPGRPPRCAATGSAPQCARRNRR